MGLKKTKYWLDAILEIEAFKINVQNVKSSLEGQKNAKYIGLTEGDIRVILTCLEITLKESDCQIEYAVKEMKKEEKK